MMIQYIRVLLSGCFHVSYDQSLVITYLLYIFTIRRESSQNLIAILDLKQIFDTSFEYYFILVGVREVPSAPCVGNL